MTAKGMAMERKHLRDMVMMSKKKGGQ
jgi:hypothetical protein